MTDATPTAPRDLAKPFSATLWVQDRWVCLLCRDADPDDPEDDEDSSSASGQPFELCIIFYLRNGVHTNCKVGFGTAEARDDAFTRSVLAPDAGPLVAMIAEGEKSFGNLTATSE